jgi:purine-binding chemotaxis protein CheW
MSSSDYVTLKLDGQLFGIPVLQVQDILSSVVITHVPLAPPEIAGSLNLRGRVVTAISLRSRLGIEKSADIKKPMNIVVEHKNELYSLIVDSVGEVLNLEDDDFAPNPPTMAKHLREISRGIFQLDQELLIIMDVPTLLNLQNLDAA